MSPNPRRYETLDEMIDEYQIDGVIEVVLQACHTFAVESTKVKRFVTLTLIRFVYINLPTY